ncbi:unnamed protein product [Rotaria sp. Silwood2]|nr:unnamed protein product [Rotaria sp. Silwood2]CAF4587254.1 unnamed protein product [Rotaria sp. Silwood2]
MELTNLLSKQIFIETYNASSFRQVPNLGGSVFSGSAASTKINNRKYVIEKQDYEDFSQIAVTNNDERFIGIRESASAPLSLGVAEINRTTCRMNTIGIYPAGSFSYVMVYASKRELYYNVIASTLYGINVRTESLEIQIPIPNDYTIYELDYDSTTDRLIALVYSRSTANAWFLAQVIITGKHQIHFDRIGKSEIPFEKYFWATIYTMDTKNRLWRTL